jgi:NADH:ubiquinone oxidoreductase subunit K
MFVMPFAVRIFIKMHKGDGHFNMSANLVTAAQLPVMMIGLFNVITGGVISGVLASVDVLVDCASYMLIFAGISKALGGKKPIWSFFLMIICATAATVVITVFVASPVIFSRVAYSLMDSFNVK